jgi:serine/threonine protein kinase
VNEAFANCMEYVRDDRLWSEWLSEHGYDLLGRLDSGSFSDVFAVRVRGTNEAVAVKRLVARRDVHSDPALVAELACLTLLRELRGSCVVRLEGSVVLDRLACLVLELAPLGNLECYALAHWPLPPRLVHTATRQLLTALDHCHRLHIAHRDLNPANVLLVSLNVVRLADFGLAVQCHPDPATRRRPLCAWYMGRQSYLAPEVLQHNPYDPLLADLWSMGCLLAFLLTGNHPVPHRPSATQESTLKLQLPRCGDREPQAHSKKSTPFRSRHRTHSGESDGFNSCTSSVRSDSDTDEGFVPLKSYDPFADRNTIAAQPLLAECSDGTAFPWASATESADDAVFHGASSFTTPGHPPDHQAAVNSTCSIDAPASPDAIRTELSKESRLESALSLIVSRLCAVQPNDRLQADETLQLWKELKQFF